VDGIAVAATNAVANCRADTVIAALVLAASTALPASGTYAYTIRTVAGQTYNTTISIASGPNGVTTHELFGPSPIAATEQHFDSALHELSFAAQQPGRDKLTITFAQSKALYSIGGHTHELALDAPDCILVADNVLTSAVILPSVLRATGATDCTYVLSTAVQMQKGFVLDTPPQTHPTQAAPNDASVTIDVNGRHETVWYDPKTLIPDYIDFGEGVGNAILVR
jgi:hypothetical protein